MHFAKVLYASANYTYSLFHFLIVLHLDFIPWCIFICVYTYIRYMDICVCVLFSPCFLCFPVMYHISFYQSFLLHIYIYIIFLLLLLLSLHAIFPFIVCSVCGVSTVHICWCCSRQPNNRTIRKTEWGV